LLCGLRFFTFHYHCFFDILWQYFIFTWGSCFGCSRLSRLNGFCGLNVSRSKFSSTKIMAIPFSGGGSNELILNRKKNKKESQKNNWWL
jgi:hypothetical protein